MADETKGRTLLDIATELTIALVEKEHVIGVDNTVDAFQKLYNAASYAHANKKNPQE